MAAGILLDIPNLPISEKRNTGSFVLRNGELVKISDTANVREVYVPDWVKDPNRNAQTDWLHLCKSWEASGRKQDVADAIRYGFVKPQRVKG